MISNVGPLVFSNCRVGLRSVCRVTNSEHLRSQVECTKAVFYSANATNNLLHRLLPIPRPCSYFVTDCRRPLQCLRVGSRVSLTCDSGFFGDFHFSFTKRNLLPHAR